MASPSLCRRDGAQEGRPVVSSNRGRADVDAPFDPLLPGSARSADSSTAERTRR
jgi:hypothetical protein